MFAVDANAAAADGAPALEAAVGEKNLVETDGLMQVRAVAANVEAAVDRVFNLASGGTEVELGGHGFSSGVFHVSPVCSSLCTSCGPSTSQRIQ